MMGAVTTVQFSMALSVLCLVTVFAGGWYLQSSLVQLNKQLMEHQYHDQEQNEHIQQLSKQIIEQNHQNSEQQLQLEQLNIIIDVFVDRNGKYRYGIKDSNNHHEIAKRQNQQSQTEIQIDNTIIKLLHGRDGVQGKDGRDGRDGVAGAKGDTGPQGPKGNQGSKGDQGLKGDKGSNGDQGRDGRNGRDGVQGIKGDVGPYGDKGGQGLKGIKGNVGPRGDKGDQGSTGPKGDHSGGLVFVRWGHNSCPNTGAKLIYTGRAGGSHHAHKGGGSNPQCLPLDPNYLNYQSGSQTSSYMYGAEYFHTNSLVPNTHSRDVPCAVCYVPTRTALYMIPAKYTCPTGWTTEYYGFLMSEAYSQFRTMFTCVDKAVKVAIGSQESKYGLLFWPVEGRCGSLPCPPYEQTKELTCAVCTK